MKLLFTCADKPSISRNRFHQNVLKERFEYDTCISQGKTYATRIPSILARLPFKMFHKDVYFVAYMGHFLVPLMRLVTQKPIIYDFYLSLYDVMCHDRKLYTPSLLFQHLPPRRKNVVNQRSEFGESPITTHGERRTAILY